MKASDEIKKFISKQEGCKLTAYKPLPTDRWTIGYGTTFYSPTRPVEEGDTIDEETAMGLLSDNIDDLSDGLSIRILPSLITQNQFDAVVSLTYNIGLRAFRNSATGQMFYDGHNISNRFEEWVLSAGRVIPGLVARRQKEKNIYDNSDYTA